MRRQLRPSKTSAPPANSQVLRFISRAKQLELRGRRNYDRYMQVGKRFVDPDGPERAQWQWESAEESVPGCRVEPSPWAYSWWRSHSSMATAA
jgi:hypothetical protein